MTWKKLKLSYYQLIQKISESNNIQKEWNEFLLNANKLYKSPPMALVPIIKAVKIASEGKKINELKILDHGCGSGLKTMFLYANGFTSAYGVNVNFDVNHLNKIVNLIFKFKDTRFIQTDGKTLPFDTNYFDFILSCQVVEHLQEEVVDLYYSEEGRVLKSGGIAYHQVPHSFVPYDSHSRLWFAHWMPSFLQPILYGIVKSIRDKKNCLKEGKKYAKRFNGEFVALRSPYYHYNQLKKHIGAEYHNNLGLDIITNENDFSSHDKDTPLGIRKFLYFLFNLPLIGKILSRILQYFIMLHTLAIKS